DRITGDEFELDAGGPTGRRSRDVFPVRSSRAQDHRTCRFRLDGRARVFRLLVARQPERLSLRGTTGHHDESPTSTAGSDGTIGNETNPDRDRDADRLRSLFPALSNHHFLADHKKHKRTKRTKS